jgi:hypothetical protein
MLTNLEKAPFQYWGGKADASEAVWEALGDVPHFVDPFMGSLAVLLRRPHQANRTYFSETVSDLDGLLVNAFRSIQMSPDATADAASWPVAEADLHARHLALLRWRADNQLEHLMGDPTFHDPVMAGWWIWGQSCWIGSGWCSGDGAWTVGDDGRIAKREKGGEGVGRQIPHLGNDGKGPNTAAVREPGVSRQAPNVSDDGHGVNRPQIRESGDSRLAESGVHRKLPNVSDDGRGPNHPGLREPGTSGGVRRKMPNVNDSGHGVNRPQVREEGVARQLPAVSKGGQGSNHPALPESGTGLEPDFHPMTMPELLRWFRFLSARLRHVRILNGDWRRAVTNGATKILTVRQGDGPCGIFLDPPYGEGAGRQDKLYAHDSLTVAAEAREWALSVGDDPQLRIVFAGYEGEHGDAFKAAGWREREWFKKGFLKGGMANQSKDGHQQARERLWLSPHCLGAEVKRQGSLF